MAGRFMKVKRIIIPFITLVIMTSQLAGCATMNSDEMLKSMQESPDVSIEYAIPDEEQQSLDASGVINIGDQQIVSDSDSEGDIGVIDNQQEVKELSGAELLDYFQLSYDTINDIMPSRSTDEKISYVISTFPCIDMPNMQILLKKVIWAKVQMKGVPKGAPFYFA